LVVIGPKAVTCFGPPDVHRLALIIGEWGALHYQLERGGPRSAAVIPLEIFSWILLANETDGPLASNADELGGSSVIAVLDMNVKVLIIAHGADAPSREDRDADSGERPTGERATEDGSAARHGKSVMGGGSSERKSRKMQVQS